MKKIIAFLLVFASVFSCFAQRKNSVSKKTYHIDVTIKGVADTTLLLGYHYGSKKLVCDTTRVDSKGHGVFEGDSLLNGGLYLILTPDYRYFEIMIDDENQQFKLVTDTTNLFDNLKVYNSESNQVFLDYQHKSSEVYKTRKPTYDTYKALKEEDTTTMDVNARVARRDSMNVCEATIDSLHKVMIDYENQVIAQHPSYLLSSILGCTHEVEVPDYPRDENGVIKDSLFKYTYAKNHFFDNINLADERLLRTPVYEPKIDDYFDKQLFQIPDSIVPQVDILMTKILQQEGKGVEGNMYYTTLNHLFMKYQNPKFMGLDNIFVHIMKKYYLSGQVPARVVKDTAYMNKITDRYNKMVNNQIGVVAKDMLVYKMGDKDTLTESMGWFKLSMVPNDYIVIYFWDTDCGHCKKIIPEWHKLYRENEFKKKGVASFMVYTQTDMDKWKQFVQEKDMFDFINVFDPYQNTNFRTNYDIYSTPVVYVLNKERKIIAKRLPPETVVEVLNRELEKDADNNLEQKRKSNTKK